MAATGCDSNTAMGPSNWCVPDKTTGVPCCVVNVCGAEACKDTGDVGLLLTGNPDPLLTPKDWPMKKPPKDTVGAYGSLANP